ncbi:mitochondrial carrier [Sistotremastrum niveocremeum HHB9708]|uniref:Mitochondrial carrier n=1 Tax=Sistotremastrum niveocremeum HHB9708 TaxID=1314777 RepID=A0A164YVQ8_9AGAM|nr:mitochondrial carrier [Sistotremastrum niveocremeum HHB9708]
MDVPVPDLSAHNLKTDSLVIRGLKDVAFGSTAGIISKVFEHPFDLTKVRLQTQVLESSARFSGPLDCLQQTWKNEGIRGLYRGLPAPIVGAMAENAIIFFAYSEFQNVIRSFQHIPVSEALSIPQLSLAAAGAGAVTSFALTPIELVKCKMQVQMLAVAPIPAIAGLPAESNPSFKKLPGPGAIVASIIKQDGWRGLWLGHTGTLIREIGGGAAWFGANEITAKWFMTRRAQKAGRPLSEFSKKDLSAFELAVAGGVAGISYNIALFPADTIKSTIQTEEELRPRVAGDLKPRSTFWSTGKELWKAQGIRGLYAGCGVTLVKAVPSSAMIFLIYDLLKTRFG